MHFPTTLALLSTLTLLTAAAPQPSATFDTFSVPNCDSAVLQHNYQRVNDQECNPLPDAKSIKVYWTRDMPIGSTCRSELLMCRKEGRANGSGVVNTFSGERCTGAVESYKFESYNAPCRPVIGKVSYNVTC